MIIWPGLISLDITPFNLVGFKRLFETMRSEALSSFVVVAAVAIVLVNGLCVSAQEPLSVHVLDNEFGGNAVNMTCELYKLENDEFVYLETSTTDSNGRILEFIPFEDYVPGIYMIWFGTKDYYSSRNISTFFPAVQITYEVTDPLLDYHIPLILSPYGYSTYRGS